MRYEYDNYLENIGISDNEQKEIIKKYLKELFTIIISIRKDEYDRLQ